MNSSHSISPKNKRSTIKHFRKGISTEKTRCSFLSWVKFTIVVCGSIVVIYMYSGSTVWLFYPSDITVRKSWQLLRSSTVP